MCPGLESEETHPFLENKGRTDWAQRLFLRTLRLFFVYLFLFLFDFKSFCLEPPPGLGVLFPSSTEASRGPSPQQKLPKASKPTRHLAVFALDEEQRLCVC